MRRHYNDACGVMIEYTRGQQVQCETTVLIDNRMTGVASALETDDDVRLLGQHVCNLTFTLVAPVGANDSSYHSFILLKAVPDAEGAASSVNKQALCIHN